MAGHPTRDEQRAIQRRRDDAIQLRLAGVDSVTIGRRLAADPAVNSDGVAYPMGYGIDAYRAGEEPLDDERLARLVREDLRRVWNQRRASIDNGLEDLRDLQDARLERLFIEAYTLATKKDDKIDAATKLAALDKATKLMERQARLHGLDAPAKQEISGPDGGPVELTAVERARMAAIEHANTVRLQLVKNREALEAAVPPDGDEDDHAAG